MHPMMTTSMPARRLSLSALTIVALAALPAALHAADGPAGKTAASPPARRRPPAI
jgi:hypothetical protein